VGPLFSILGHTMAKAEIQAGLRLAAKTSDTSASKVELVVVRENQDIDLKKALVAKIISATWAGMLCDGKPGVDASEAVEAALAMGKPMKATSKNLGVVDPAPFRLKHLCIQYQTAAVQEIPVDSDSFTVYQPESFRKLRAALRIDEGEFFGSMTRHELKGGDVQKSGKSGEIFWFTPDGKYVMKTCADPELQNLLSMLPEYTTYLGENKDTSMLTRYLGAYRLTFNDGKSIQFVVMNNVFQGGKPSRTYDLKGTTEDRWVDPASGGVMKDNNFNGYKVHIGDDLAPLFYAAVKSDTEFLEARGIMDYSMMLGVAPADQTPDDTGRPFHRVMGGIPATIVKTNDLEQAPEKCVVYFGMVDMLVHYNWKKVVANFAKGQTIGWVNKIDTEPPDVYAARFRQTFRRKVKPRAASFPITKANLANFETPMPAMGMSGGTASFFKAILKENANISECPEVKESRQYWVAKDLERARDEVGFYEAAMMRKNKPGFDVLKWMTPYKGLCKAPCMAKPDKPSDITVMLLRNGRDGFKCCRMLDIKIGWATAVAGWQGKSAFGAWKQKILDSQTNSTEEGFRLEGFDNPPPSLKSVERLIATGNTPVAKKAHRFNLQRLAATEFVSFFLDMHGASRSSFAAQEAKAGRKMVEAAPRDRESLSEVEHQETILLQCIQELSQYIKACRNVSVPQQWIGSSIMLAFDSEEVPKRGDVRNLARVHIFDWGRSELNTPAVHDSLSPEEQKERHQYWGYYCTGVAFLLFDLVSLYVGRYWYKPEAVAFSLWDKDKVTNDDLIGVCTLPLIGRKQVLLEARPLKTATGSPAKAGGLLGLFRKETKLEVSVEPVKMRSDSRFETVWCASAHGTKNVPRMDALSPTDAFVEVATTSDSNSELEDIIRQDPQYLNHLRCTAHRTTVAVDEGAPVFNEGFEVGVLKKASRRELLDAMAGILGKDATEEQVMKLFPPSVKDLDGTGDRQVKFSELCFPLLQRPKN